MSVAQIQEHVLGLSLADRLSLTRSLLATFAEEQPMEADFDAPYVEEILRRSRELENDPAAGFDHEEVFAAARQSLQ